MDKPLYLLASEVLKHLKNRNYGLAEATLLELWERLAAQHHEEEKTENE